MRTFAAIDFETANNQRTSICSIGIIFVEEGKTVDHFYHLVKPAPNFYNYWNTRIHGITFGDTSGKEEFPDVWERVRSRLQGMPLIAHNSSFDEGCLKAVHQLFGLSYPDYQFHCTCRAAKRAFPTLENHKLKTVAAHIGFDLQHHHHALADAEACAEIAKLIIPE